MPTNKDLEHGIWIKTPLIIKTHFSFLSGGVGGGGGGVAPPFNIRGKGLGFKVQGFRVLS